MKFKFSGLSLYEKNARPNFMNDAESHSVTKEFESIEAAIQYVAEHNGFMVSDDGKFAFSVRNITEVK